MVMKKMVFIVIFLALAGFTGYRVFEALTTESTKPAASSSGSRGYRGTPVMRVPLVESVAASEGSLEDRVSLVGSLRPIAEVQVMSKIAGRLEKIPVDVGDPVKEGELLAQVEDREILQQIQQAEAAISVARASIHQREAELQNFDRQVERYRELFNQNLISRQDLEDVATRQLTSTAQLELSRAQLRQSEANLNTYNINLENTRSYAPMSGFVGRRYVHPGALVTANTPLLYIVDLRTLRMVVNMVERDIVRVRRGVQAQVTVDAFPGRAFSGRIQRVAPVLDAATRTGEVEIQVANDRLDLRAEMFARVTLNLGGERRGILVPRESVVYRGEKSGVFIVEENHVKFRPVQPGLTQKSSVEIIKGLQPGDRLVGMGASLLQDGDEIRLRDEEAPDSTSEDASASESSTKPAGS